MDISNISASKAGAVPPASPRAAAAGASSAPVGSSSDRIEVSPQARELARAEQAAHEAVQQSGDLRFDVVSRLRAEVRDGTYRVDAQVVARAMVERGEQSE